MKLVEASILIVPGWSGSGPEHWQTRWQAKMPNARRVEQDDWFRPVLHRWLARLVEAVEEAPRPVVLVAHSAGVPLVAHAAPRLPSGRVAGAFLVAPPSEANLLALEGMSDPDFAPFPRAPLPFPAVLVASRNDPLCDFTDADAFAAAWGADLVDAGEAGHINSASGHGPWPEGLMRLGRLLSRL